MKNPIESIKNAPASNILILIGALTLISLILTALAQITLLGEVRIIPEWNGLLSSAFKQMLAVIVYAGGLGIGAFGLFSRSASNKRPRTERENHEH